MFACELIIRPFRSINARFDGEVRPKGHSGIGEGFEQVLQNLDF